MVEKRSLQRLTKGRKEKKEKVPGRVQGVERC